MEVKTGHFSLKHYQVQCEDVAKLDLTVESFGLFEEYITYTQFFYFRSFCYFRSSPASVSTADHVTPIAICQYL